MSRLTEDIALLERVFTIAGKAIWSEDKVTVPPATLAVLAEDVQRVRLEPRDYRLIGDEVVWLLQSAHRLQLERLDDNRPKAERWMRIAELLASSVALDLENAKKSVGEIA